MLYIKIKQKLTSQNKTKQAEGEEPKERHKKWIQLKGPTRVHTQEAHKNPDLEAMIYTQRTCGMKWEKNMYKYYKYYKNKNKIKTKTWQDIMRQGTSSRGAQDQDCSHMEH